MARCTCWGDRTSLIALVEIYGVRIKVYTLGRVLSKVVNEVDGRGEGQQRGLAIMISSWGEAHYDWAQPAPEAANPPCASACSRGPWEQRSPDRQCPSATPAKTQIWRGNSQCLLSL